MSNVHAVQRHLAGTSKIHVAYIPLIIYYYNLCELSQCIAYKRRGHESRILNLLSGWGPKTSSNLERCAYHCSSASVVLSRWWLNQPIWKICSSIWIIFPGRGENKRYLKPPPSYDWFNSWWQFSPKQKVVSGFFSMNWLSNQGVDLRLHTDMKPCKGFEVEKLDPYQSTSWQLGSTCNFG